MTHKRDTSGLRPPWKPGESGNPKGGGKGPRRVPLIAMVRRELRRRAKARGLDVSEGQDEILAAQAIADEIENGTPAIIKEYLDRTDGPVRREVDLNVGVAETVRAEFDEFLKPKGEPDRELLPREAEFDELPSAASEPAIERMPRTDEEVDE